MPIFKSLDSARDMLFDINKIATTPTTLNIANPNPALTATKLFSLLKPK